MTNALAESASAYLRAHAENPVEWLPWGEAAFARARAEQKPILLSIGYASCYWCHVMEREVFENPAVAAVMNAHFINIKMDREEHPALDEVYMAARQLITREGGWPNHVWLTPELKPFFAGGTFGAEDAYGKPGFPRLLENIHGAWQNERQALEAQAERLMEGVRSFMNRAEKQKETPQSAALAEALTARLAALADKDAGGFYAAPKFPHETYLFFLLSQAQRGDRAALGIATQALYAMSAGGIYDHVGGGFHRYAVDKNWLVPHFEKMLYNQALLSRAYLRHYALTGNEHSGYVVLNSLAFALAAFTAPEGGFYSAIDAENDGVEGAYYAWTESELKALLAPEQLEFLLHYYRLVEIPHFPGHKPPSGKALVAQRPLPDAAAEEGISYREIMELSQAVMMVLRQARNARIAPLMDDKILTGWNGLMITALAEAAEIFGLSEHRLAAQNAARFALEKLRGPDGGLAHMWALGAAHHTGVLEDYAYLCEGLLALHRADKNDEWQHAAMRLMDEAHAQLWDAGRGGYFASPEAADILIRPRHAEDGALPAPNGVMLHNLVRLHASTGEARFKERADALAEAFTPAANASLTEYASLIDALCARDAATEAPQAVALTLALELEPPEPVAGGECELRIHLRIAEGWHIGGYDAPAQPTLVRIDGGGVARVIRVQYPPPLSRSFRKGEPLSIYESEAVIVATLALLRTPSGRRGEIRVEVKCQPCREHSCALPLTLQASI